MSKQSLIDELKIWISSIFKINCKIIEKDSHIYQIYLNNNLAYKFTAFNLEEFKYRITVFKLMLSSELVA